MRSDMAKILVERPRIEGRVKGRGLPRDLDEAPFRQGIRPRGSGVERKVLNENLAPLQRYLQKQVGRPWDKVKSEISEQVKRTNTVQNHIFQHLDGFVEEHALLIDGIPYHITYGGISPLVTYYSRHRTLYVCPKSGLLKIAKKPRENKSAASIKVRRLDPMRCLVFVKGCWHLADMAEIAPRYLLVQGQYVSKEVDEYVKDAVFGSTGSSRLEAVYGRGHGKRQYAEVLRPLRHEESRHLLMMTRDEDTRSFGV